MIETTFVYNEKRSMKISQINLKEAQQLHQAGLLAEAHAQYLQLLQSNPNDADVLQALGLLSAQQQDFTSAVDYLQKAIVYQPDNPAIHLNLGNALKAQGLYSQALQVLQQAIELNPNYSLALNNIGTIYYIQEKWELAIQYYQLAIQHQTNYIEAYYNLGLAYAKHADTEKAIQTYKNILDYIPEHAAACFQLGCLFLLHGQVNTALRYFLIVETAHPTHFETQTNLATCYLKQGALNQAKMHYKKALDLSPLDTQILYNLGVICMQQGHIDAAIQYYQRAIQIDPLQYAVHNNLGVAFLLKQHPAFALQHFKEALRLQPNNEAIRYSVQMLAQDERLLTSPPDYIKTLFDAYADHYDMHLRQSLDYQIPELLLAAILQQVKKPIDWDILDLGCGTGLCGAAFKPYAKSLVGIDLSAKMLDIAREKNLYTNLIVGNLQTSLAQSEQTYDLIIAGDVLVYIGDLANLFSEIKKSLRPLGFFVFNTEITEQADYTMNQSGRFAHQAKYLVELAQQNSLRVVSYQKIISRMQNNEPVYGHLYVLQSTSV
jgi:predicted TPR repeat methyltransferase